MKKEKNNQEIRCKVHDCKFCDCDIDCCCLEKIEVCNCAFEEEKEATMCNSYEKK